MRALTLIIFCLFFSGCVTTQIENNFDSAEQGEQYFRNGGYDVVCTENPEGSKEKYHCTKKILY